MSNHDLSVAQVKLDGTNVTIIFSKTLHMHDEAITSATAAIALDEAMKTAAEASEIESGKVERYIGKANAATSEAERERCAGEADLADRRSSAWSQVLAQLQTIVGSILPRGD